MSWLPSRLARRARALFRPVRVDRELAEEMRFHVAAEADELERQGVPPAEARRRALVAFGGLARHQDAHRDARGVRWIEETAQDLRYAARALVRAPAFSLSAVLVLALGIGAATAAFSAVDAVLIARLPYPEDDRLVRIYQQNSPTNRWGLSVVDYQAIEEESRSFSAVGLIRGLPLPVSFGRNVERMVAGAATSGVFRALGIASAHGRLLEPGDDRVGAPHVVVVSHALATRAFGRPASALGRTVTIDGVAHAVVGVLAPGVDRLAGARSDLWRSLPLDIPTRRGPFGQRVVARLADGVTLDAARRDLAGVSERIFPKWAASFQDRTARMTPVALREAILGEAPRTLGLLGGAVALVFLIVIANVASLMLVRATARWREVTLRTTLGATRSRIARLLIAESLVLAAVGAIAGVVFGYFALQALIAIGSNVPRLAEARLDLRAVAFTVALALAGALAIGAAPVALLFGRSGAAIGRDAERAGGTRRTHSLRGAFVAAQFALALPLLAGAALLLSSFARLQRVDPGFDARGLFAVLASIPGAGYDAPGALDAFWGRAIPRLRDALGTAQVGLSEGVPPDDQNVSVNNFDLVDHPVPPGGAQPTAPWMGVTSDYFAALGVPLLEGRLFTPADTGTAPPVVVVSRSWAKRYFPEGKVIGRQFIDGGCTTCPRTTVVGVVGDVKYQGLAGDGDAVYYPTAQGAQRDIHIFFRTTLSAAEATARVRAALESVDPAVALTAAAALEDRVYASVARPRHWSALLGSFAAVAMLLAAIGIFGMLTYAVSTRRREIGVRMALGARASSVVTLIVRRGMAYAVLGVILGLVVSVAGTRWLAAMLYGVSPTDPLLLGAAAVVLLAVALVASWLPARRAAGIHPMEAIRGE